MAHPTTRAERRHHRRRIINSGLNKAFFLHWFSRHCSCWPHGYIFSHRECNMHGELTLADRRTAGMYAKTGPYNWIDQMEPEWALMGKVRRDFRQGGGRRAQEWGVKTGRYAGRFRLPIALDEWNDTDTEVVV